METEPRPNLVVADRLPPSNASRLNAYRPAEPEPVALPPLALPIPAPAPQFGRSM